MVATAADGHRPVTRGMSALTCALRRTRREDESEGKGEQATEKAIEGKGAQKRAETREGGH